MNLKALLSLKNVIVDKPCDRLERGARSQRSASIDHRSQQQTSKSTSRPSPTPLATV